MNGTEYESPGGRYERQTALFGATGQENLAAATILIAGCGGLGSHAAQQLAHLGVGRLILVDDDTVEESNLNRLIGATEADIGREKVQVVARFVQAINPSVRVTPRPATVPYDELASDLAAASVVFSGVDRETPRLALLAAAAEHGTVLVDAATEVVSTSTGLMFGGRVVVCGTGQGCLFCRNVLDSQELNLEAMGPEQRTDHAAIYGVDRAAVAGSGPSVVSLNGVVASLAVSEMLMHLTGLRTPVPFQRYNGYQGIVTVAAGSPTAADTCPYCASFRRAQTPSA